MTFNQLTLKEALDALANSSLTIEELYRDLNLAIKEKNQFYNIYLNLNDQAEQQAVLAQDTKLKGLPIAVKDNFCTKNLKGISIGRFL